MSAQRGRAPTGVDGRGRPTTTACALLTPPAVGAPEMWPESELWPGSELWPESELWPGSEMWPDPWPEAAPGPLRPIALISDAALLADLRDPRLVLSHDYVGPDRRREPRPPGSTVPSGTDGPGPSRTETIGATGPGPRPGVLAARWLGQIVAVALITLAVLVPLALIASHAGTATASKGPVRPRAAAGSAAGGASGAVRAEGTRSARRTEGARRAEGARRPEGARRLAAQGSGLAPTEGGDPGLHHAGIRTTVGQGSPGESTRHQAREALMARLTARRAALRADRAARRARRPFRSGRKLPINGHGVSPE